jgi:hypothetical protein
MSNTNIEALRIHDGDRFCSALVKVGNKLMHAVVMDDFGVRVITAPKEDLRYSAPLLRKGAPYPVAKMAMAMKTWGRHRGMTEAAKKLLDEAILEAV